MILTIKVLTVQATVLSLILRTQVKMEGENQFHKIVICFHMCTEAHALPTVTYKMRMKMRMALTNDIQCEYLAPAVLTDRYLCIHTGVCTHNGNMHFKERN